MTTITSEKKKLSYFREVQNELKKVTWTSKAELMFCTKAVIIATFLFGFAIYLVDFGIGAILKTANMLFQTIFG
ncbi:MAG TPA: preprotein translocase subunit SecE [Chlamydiales bacterium]|nr:preprotein translocase subunit SecE [Chlamydiales bacterium]